MKHCIIIKWNDKVADKDLYFEKSAKAFSDVTKLAGVTELKMYKSNSKRDNRADLMIKIECTKEGLENYDVSELHQAFKKMCEGLIAQKTIFDYE